ncbi:MAG: 2OG-Fe(II) oxygenase [Bacteroidetes bacterium]|nr:2OG-Fe(II) oxygenase [Bacteroidota bacterium]
MTLKIEQAVSGIYSSRYAIIEDFFDENSVNAFLLAFQNKQKLFKEAGTGKKLDLKKNKSVRGDKIAWINKGESNELDTLFFKVMDEIQLELNRRCFMGLNNSEFHFALYEPGTFYKKHQDAFKTDDSRKVSVIVYLNKNWEQNDGGELKIYLDNAKVTVAPKAGTLVVFESELEHEVVMSNVDRLSITGWLKSVKP